MGHLLGRRTFLKLAGLVGAGSVLPWRPALYAQEAGRRVISVIHTTDLHGHVVPTFNYDGVGDLGGLARCATQIATWRAENPETLLIDVGDVYQGTDVGLRTKGSVMIDLFNALRYDAWVVGNHEFDWGFEDFVLAVERSRMPVLCANVRLEGHLPEVYSGKAGAGPLKKIAPYLIKNVGGYKIAVVGATTPGMESWLRPEMLGFFEVLDPEEPVENAVAACEAEGADAILLAVHMGTRPQGDDHANRVAALARRVGGRVAAILAGHTHRPHEATEVTTTILTQASYFGIHLGKVDLVFDEQTRKCVSVRTGLREMDSSITVDPVMISLAQPALDESEKWMSTVIGTLDRSYSVESAPGQPSEVEQLIAAAISTAMAERGLPVDGVLHGLFQGSRAVPAGPITVANVWRIIPYENFVVTGDFLPSELMAILSEIFGQAQGRNLMGFQPSVIPRQDGRPGAMVLTGLRGPAGESLDPTKRYRIALNSYDGQSGGRRLNLLNSLLQQPEVNNTLHWVQTREALIAHLGKLTKPS